VINIFARLIIYIEIFSGMTNNTVSLPNTDPEEIPSVHNRNTYYHGTPPDGSVLDKDDEASSDMVWKALVEPMQNLIAECVLKPDWFENPGNDKMVRTMLNKIASAARQLELDPAVNLTEDWFWQTVFQQVDVVTEYLQQSGESLDTVEPELIVRNISEALEKAGAQWNVPVRVGCPIQRMLWKPSSTVDIDSKQQVGGDTVRDMRVNASGPHSQCQCQCQGEVVECTSN